MWKVKTEVVEDPQTRNYGQLIPIETISRISG